MLTHVAAHHTSPDRQFDGVTPLSVVTDVVTARVSVVGELDREHSHLLLQAVAALVAGGHRSISVSTEEVTFCDTGGLRALLGAKRLAARRGCQVTFVETSRCVQRLISLTGLAAVLEAPPTNTSAGGAATRLGLSSRSSR